MKRLLFCLAAAALALPACVTDADDLTGASELALRTGGSRGEALGVQCDHCHTTDDRASLAAYDEDLHAERVLAHAQAAARDMGIDPTGNCGSSSCHGDKQRTGGMLVATAARGDAHDDGPIRPFCLGCHGAGDELTRSDKATDSGHAAVGGGAHDEDVHEKWALAHQRRAE